MIGIICLDQRNGMYFNERRQSRDRYVIRDIVRTTKDGVLHINSYSKELFNEKLCKYVVSDDFFTDAKEGEYCFVENHIVDQRRINHLIVYRWDKVYPTDYKFDLSEWKLKSSEEFQGYSHDTIIKEVYEKNE